jgi:hypothetical protein
VNLALGGDSRKGYALGVEQLAQLVEAGGRDEFRPLRMDDVATADVPDFDPLPDPETPSDPPPASETPAQAVVAKLKQLAAMLGEKDWLPENAEDYGAFGEFASSVTTAADMFDKLEGAEQEESQAQLVEVLEALADARWPTQEQMQGLSKLAEQAALASDAATPGVFVYAECTMRPENLNNAQVNGLPVYGFKVVLGDEVLLIPVSAGGEEITVGSEWLILGQKMGDAEIGTEAEKNHASVVHAKYLLKKPVP